MYGKTKIFYTQICEEVKIPVLVNSNEWKWILR